MFQRLNAIHYRHCDIERHIVGRKVFVELDAFGAVCRLAYNIEAVFTEQLNKDFPDKCGVINNENCGQGA